MVYNSGMGKNCKTSLSLCVGFALLAGCAPFSSALTGERSSAGNSWVDPGAKAQALLYISDLGANSVDIYTYPAGVASGKLTGFGSVAGLCSNKAGDVFVVDEAGPVQVFAHGGTSPIRKLTTSGAPYGCAVDPATGNLAVTNLSSVDYGTVAIYTKAMGTGKKYTDASFSASYFCGFDNSGNLFIDGGARTANFILAELPKGYKGFKPIKFTKTVESPGGVQFDGKDFAVGDKGAGLIYRTTEAGGVVQTITLDSGTDVEQFWIDGTTLIGPNAASPGVVPFWHYPAGGKPSKTMSGFYYPIGATVSV